MKFCMGVGVHDVVTHANLGDDRFTGFEGVGVEFPTFPLTCVVVLITLWHYREVWYKVSLYVNCQRQSCRAFIGLAMRAKNIGGDVPFYLKFWVKVTALARNHYHSICRALLHCAARNYLKVAILHLVSLRYFSRVSLYFYL